MIPTKYTTNIPRYVAETKDGFFFDQEGKACLISISWPGQEKPKLKDGWTDILSLAFWDVIRPTKGLLLAEHPDEVIYPLTDEDAEAIANFIKIHRNETIIIHCQAGKSRSAAVARLLSELGWHYENYPSEWGLDFYNVEVYSKVKKHFPELLPAGAT